MSTVDAPRSRTAQELMSSPVLAVEPGLDVASALRVMRQYRVHHLPVVEDRYCVGMVGEVELLASLTGDQGDPVFLVGELCRRPPPTVAGTAHRDQVAATMLDEDTDALVVLDGTEVVGMVTALDLVRSLVAATETAPGRAPGRAPRQRRGTAP